VRRPHATDHLAQKGGASSTKGGASPSPTESRPGFEFGFDGGVAMCWGRARGLDQMHSGASLHPPPPFLVSADSKRLNSFRKTFRMNTCVDLL